MKKLLLLFILIILPLAASAQWSVGDTFTATNTQNVSVRYKVVSLEPKQVEVAYDRNNETQRAAIPMDYEGVITIPEEVNGFTVVGVGNYAFSMCRKVTKIGVPATVTYVGDGAFSSCDNLERVGGLVYIQRIGRNGFAYCEKLAGLTLPETLTFIGAQAFHDCASLTSLNIPKSVTEIENNFVTAGCTGLQTITVDMDNPKYDSRDDCNAIVETETNKLIAGCVKTVIPESIVEITAGAFSELTNLTEITIPAGVEAIAFQTFQGCTGLQSVTMLREEPFAIDESTFTNYSGDHDLIYTNATLYVPNGCVETYRATEGWSEFQKIEEIGGSQELAVGDTFTATNTQNVSVRYKVVSLEPKQVEVAYDRNNETQRAAIPMDYEGVITIPEEVNGFTVVGVGNYAFSMCRKVTKIGVPATVTYVGDGAFSSCDNLERVGGLVYIQRIGRNGFAYCEKLAGLTLPETLTFIGAQAFHDCASLTSLNIPKSVTEIENNFVTAGCTGLQTITVDMDNPKYDSRDDCNAIVETETNKLIAGCVKTVIPESIVEITAGAFSELTNLTEITIPAGVEAIAFQTFQGCTGLQSVTMLREEPFAIDESTFTNYSGDHDLIYTNATLYVPNGCVETYRATEGWSKFQTIEPYEVPFVADCEFSDVPNTNDFYEPTCYLYKRDILSGSDVSGKMEVETPLLRAHLANITFRGLFTLNGREIPSTFVSDQYPGIYDDLKSDASYYQAAKTLLYLDYGDGITPFDRDRDGFFPDGNESRINILKELMEAFNIKPDMEGTENPFPNDPDITSLPESSPIKMGYVRQAAKLGIITTENEKFRPYDDCLRGEAFLMLARIIQKIEAGEITDPNPQESDFLDPYSGTGTVDPNAEPYAVLSDNNSVVTFYYDGKKAARGGVDINNSYIGIGSYSPYIYALTAVIDASFANYRPTSTAHWFEKCYSLKSITGMENLKTDDVTSMEDMFADCLRLESLDVTGFNTQNVSTMGYMFHGCSGLTSLDVTHFNTQNVTSMYSMFEECSGLTSLDLSHFNTENVTDMKSMFEDCSGLTSLDMSNFNTANVTNMYRMFFGCSGLTSLNVTHFNTQNVEYMGHMFYGCSGLTSLDVTGFNTQKVKFMDSMFYSCSGLTSLDVSNFKTDNVMSMGRMFYGCSGLTSLDLSNFNTSKVISGYYYYTYYLGIESMFSGCSELTTIYVGDGWTTANLTESSDVFKDCINLKGGAGTIYDAGHVDYTYAHIDGGTDNPGYFTYKNVTPSGDADPEPYAVLSDNNTVLTFYYDNKKAARGGMDINNSEIGSKSPYGSATTAVIDASFADYRPTSTAHWFERCSSLTIITGMENLKTSNVTNMCGMFGYCSGLTSLDLSGFNTQNVTDMCGMFDHCSSLTSLDLSGFNTQNVTSMNAMFFYCSGLKSLDLSGFNTQNVTTMHYMFYECSGLTSLNLTGFKTDKVTNMYGMFSGCSSLKSLDVTGFNTQNVTTMGYMFAYCDCLANLDVTGFNTQKVTEMYGMFWGCSSLTSLDLSGFYTKNVTNMGFMFNRCSSLTTIYAGDDWSTAAVTYGGVMFTNCKNLKGGAGTVFDANHTDHTYAHIDGGTSNPGYFTYKNATPSGDAEPYAVLTDNDDEITTDEGTIKGKTLTFYYDNQKEDRGGMSVVFSSTADRGWGIECEKITKAVFDGSFANCTTLTSTRWWFLFCKNLITIIGITNLKTDNVTNMTGMFYGCSSLTSLDLSSLNTSSLNIMYGIFQDCSGLKSINLTNFKTDNVEDMGQLFLNCSSLESLDVSGFKTDGVTSMFNMFRGCSSLKSLDLSIFNTKKVRNMGQMFRDCSNLATINVGGDWNTEAVTESSDMFINCNSLVGGAGTTYSPDHIKKEYAHIDGGADNPGYFTAKAGDSGEQPEGDLNGDGKVDDDDLEVLVSVVMGGNKDKLAVADLNHDGKVDAADIVTLVNIIKSQK